MLNDFANEIEEIIHLAGGSNATLSQVRQDLAVIVERMRAAQHRVQADLPSACPECGVSYSVVHFEFCPLANTANR